MAQHNMQEIMRLLDAVVNDSYQVVEPESYPDQDQQQLIRTINEIFAQKQQIHDQHRESLGRSEKRLREIIETTPVGICITSEDGIFEYVNPPYCRLYGYEQQELIGKHFTIVVPESQRHRLSNLHAEFMGRRWELRGEWTVQRKDGTPMNILADAAYIIDVDERPKKVTFVVDITDRKRAEEQLHHTVHRLNEEIEQRTRIEKIKGEVERIIQHDLRNPLNGILTATELLLRDDLTDHQRELAVLIQESGKKLNTMISSSMDFVRMEEGTYELQVQELNLVDILSDVRSEIIGIARSQGVKLHFVVNGASIDWNDVFLVYGEEVYLEDLLVNLVRNAVEASSEGESVTISIGTGDTCVIDIHNAGVIPVEIRHRFFERYTTFGKRNGNGLGTYIARLITRAHNGSIRFTTEEGEGTHLVVELPRIPVPGLLV